MFRAAPMVRLQVVTLARDERAVLEGLGRLGVMHLMRTQSGSDTAPLAPADVASELARYERIGARIQELRKSLEIPPLSKKLVEIYSSHGEEAGVAGALTTEGSGFMSIEEAKAPAPLLVEERLRMLEEQSANLLSNRRHLLQRQKELTAISERAWRYRGFEIPLSGLDQFSFLHFVTGSLPVENFVSLENEVGDNAALLPIGQEKGQQALFAITTRQGWAGLERRLQQAGFQQEILPVVKDSTVDRLLGETEREQKQLTAELEQVNSGLKSMSLDFAIPLAEIEEFKDMEYRLLDASQKFSRTEATVLIAGWVPAGNAAVVERYLGEITSDRYALRTSPPDPSSDEQVPVLLKHSRLLQPFEMLVSTYGLPNYRELEPTFFVALSYIVMFGMMFGDAGHGMVLIAGGLIALLAGRSEKVRDVGLLLLFGGSSSIIFGVVYGSYFGIEAFKRYALWHDPLEGDPMQLMYGAIGIGFVMISLGLVLNVINRFRQGDVIGGVLDKFGLVGLLFYWGTIIFLMNGPAIRSRGLLGASVVLFFIVPILGWCLKEPIQHFLSSGNGKHSEMSGGMAGAIMESCVGAFEAVLSYLANTISFVRLAAYAMSHAALLFAAFMLAAQVRDFPYGGSLWSLLVIIFGNLIAIVLEGVIASVQALRLEYYEFFGKFFSGSGQPFEPFRLPRITRVRRRNLAGLV